MVDVISRNITALWSFDVLTLTDKKPLNNFVTESNYMFVINAGITNFNLKDVRFQYLP